MTEGIVHPFILPLESHTDFRGTNTIIFDAAVSSQLPAYFHVVQINTAYSEKIFTLRGLHYQEEPYVQAKLCWVVRGSVFNVALDLISGAVITAELRPGTAMYIPRGYAHGYLTLEEGVIFQWAVDEDFHKEAAKVIRYNSCGIQWPVEPDKMIIEKRDKGAPVWTSQS